MLTLEEINSRVPTCRKCNGRFLVALPSDAETLLRLQEVLAASRIYFVKILRAATNCNLEAAKGVMEHATATATCHRCGDPIGPERFSDCESCGSLNIRLDALASGA